MFASRTSTDPHAFLPRYPNNLGISHQSGTLTLLNIQSVSVCHLPLSKTVIEWMRFGLWQHLTKRLQHGKSLDVDSSLNHHLTISEPSVTHSYALQSVASQHELPHSPEPCLETAACAGTAASPFQHWSFQRIELSLLEST